MNPSAKAFVIRAVSSVWAWLKNNYNYQPYPYIFYA